MENILNERIIEMLHALGEEIKNDPRSIACINATAAYSESHELNALITEYNVHQTALSEEYSKETRDEDVIRNIESRLEELYAQITGLDVYSDYIRAKEEYDAYFNEIESELQYVVTGHKPCAHDCSSCGGCH